MEFRKPYTQLSVPTVPVGLSLTVQSEADACDVNKILSQYKSTGMFTHVTLKPGQYGDVPVVDFQTALNMVNQATDSFDNLPSAIRNRFQNNVALFMDFVNNPANIAEGVKLGIFEPPVQAPVVPPVPSGGAGAPSGAGAASPATPVA